MQRWQEEGWKEAPVPVWNLLNYAVLQESETGLRCLQKDYVNLKWWAIPKAFALTLAARRGVTRKEDLLLRRQTFGD